MSLVVFMLLWRDHIMQSFSFVLYHRETLLTGLLNSLKKEQEKCVFLRESGRDKRVKGCTRNTYGRRCVCCTDDNRKIMKKGAVFSIADRRIERRFVCDGVWTTTGWQSERLECHWFTSETHFNFKSIQVSKNFVPRLYGFCAYGGHHMRHAVV